MNRDTVEQLIGTIFTAYTVAVSNDRKFLALELALKEKHPELYQSYLRNLGIVQESSGDMPALGFEALRTKLLQE